jgi:hypothetical protein
MAEAGGPVYEGVGRPKEGAIARVQRVLSETFTKEGRTNRYERKFYEKFGSIVNSLHLTPEQQKSLEVSVRARMEKAAVTNLTKERVGMAIVGLAGSYAAFRNREKIGATLKSIPEVFPRTGSAFEQFKNALEKTSGMGLKTRVPILLHEFGAGFKYWHPPTPQAQ